ncbi:hypothetical protein H4R19_004403 [Coemansia spiralis]|nr:hypothetical protein H4R19_004403 [Coemansia spiralis]
MADHSSSSNRRPSSVGARRPSRRVSAIDVYRDWLDEASSSEEEEAGRSTQRRRRSSTPRPPPPTLPITRPVEEAPKTHAKPAPPSEQQTKSMSTSRKLMHQMPFRSMFASPSPQPQPPSQPPSQQPPKQQHLQMAEPSAEQTGGGSLHPGPLQPDARTRNRGRQSSIDTLFSDAWIAQPTRTRRKSSVLTTHSGPLHEIPLDKLAPQVAARSTKTTVSSDSSDTVREKHGGGGGGGALSKEERMADWEFHRIDSSRGWWVVGWAALACFVSLSTLINYPVYEAYYATTARAHDPATLDDPSRGEDAYSVGGRRVSTQVVLIGTLMSGFAALGSLGAGIATDILGLRICAGAGTVVLCLGLLASSFIDKLWALCVTHGVVCGVGIALMAMPAYMAPAQWFERHRALSTGVAVAGTGLGVLALTPAYESLLRSRGLAVCLYVQAILTLALGLVASLGLRPRVTLRSPAAAVRWRRMLCDLRVLALMAMALLAAAARFAQAVCLPAIAWAAGIRDDATGVLYAMGAALLTGMVAGGAVADKTGYIAAVGLCELTLGVFTLVLYTPATSIGPVYVFALVVGLTTGALAAVLPAAIAQMLGSRRLATATGLVLAACAPALLATTPAVVKFIRLLADGRSVAWLSGLSGVLSLAAGVIGLTLPLLQRRHIRRQNRHAPTVVVQAAAA